MTNNICIIIPTLGNINKLDCLMISIINQNIEDIQLEVLVIVNGINNEKHRNALLIWSQKYDQFLQIYFLTGKGVNLARNFGLNKSTGIVSLFLDDDCELVATTFLKEHLLLHQSQPQIFATGGGYTLPLDAGFFDRIYNLIQMQWFISGINESSLTDRTHYLLGGNFSIKTEVARSQSLYFDKTIIYGGSEYDFFKNADIGGCIMQVNTLDVRHHTKESLLTLARKIYKQGQGKAGIDNKYKYTRDLQINVATKIVNADVALQVHLACSYFNIIFWSGYYFYQKKPWLLIVHIFRNIKNSINKVRYNLLDQISEQIKNKKDKGDRF